MAGLPKYQQTGRVTPDMPQLDFANVKEAFRASQTMTKGLDKLANFAFGEMGKQAEQNAMQDAIGQPLTLEQIKQANNSGESVDDLINQIGGGEIYQDTYRKFQGKQLRSQIESAAKQAMVSVNSQVKLSQLNDLEEIKSKYDSIITGMVKPLTSLSPEESILAQQSLSITASAFYKDNISKLEKDYINDQEFLSRDNVTNSLEAMKSFMSTAASPEILNESFKAIETSVYDQARSVSSEFAEEQVKELADAYDELKQNYIVEAGQDAKYADNMLDAVEKMRAGDFGEATVVYNSMTPEEQSKSRTAVISAWDELYIAEIKEKAAVLRDDKENNKSLVTELYSPNTSQDKKEDIAKLLYSKDVITQATLKSILNPTPIAPVGNALSEGRAREAIINGEVVGEHGLRSLFPDLTDTQVGKLLPIIASDAHKRAEKIIKNTVGASDSDFALIDVPTIKKILDINNRKEEIMNTISKDGTFPDVIAAAEIASKEWKVTNGTNDEVIKTVKEAIKKSFSDFEPSTMKVEEYIVRKRLDDVEAKSLRGLVKSLRDLEKGK